MLRDEFRTNRLRFSAIDSPFIARRSTRLKALFDVRQNAVELIETVVIDFELAFAARGVLDVDFCAELFRQIRFQFSDIWIPRSRRRRMLRPGEKSAHKRFRFPDR
jgi:hypothetical protein